MFLARFKPSFVKIRRYGPGNQIVYVTKTDFLRVKTGRWKNELVSVFLISSSFSDCKVWRLREISQFSVILIKVSEKIGKTRKF